MKLSKNKQKYFTSPLGEINHCNECGEPIIETNGRYHVKIDFDFYLPDGIRICNSYGYKTFCHLCFQEIFSPLNFRDAESIYKKEE